VTAPHTARVLAAVADPACFPHAPAAVDVVQTHLSIVCLAGDLVYKLKRAVTLPFVDFAPLASRRHACREEVRLNRRLCPDVYLGTAALRPDRDHALRFMALGDDDAPGDVDVAVVMRRLPQHRMLDELLREGAVDGAQIDALARHVAAFHARVAVVPAAVAAATPAALAAFAAANFAELGAVQDHGLPAVLLPALAAASRAAFARALPELEHRAASGCVVDGHGDLHARNVCMVEPPAVYDCIEFEPRFRIGDVATDIAFLVMDLRYRGAPALARRFAASYAAARGDAGMLALLPPLVAYRAMVRAKVAAIAATTEGIDAGDRDGSHASCRRHALLAAAVLAEDSLAGPTWLVVCGPPASGKSGLCAVLHEAARWPIVATDRVRKELAGVAPTARASAEHYADAFSRRTYDTAAARAAAHTAAGEAVVLLDGNFPSSDHRARAAAAAHAAGVRLIVAWVDVDAATATARAAARARAGDSVSDADAGVAAALHARFVAPAPAENLTVVRVDGALPPGDAAAAVLIALLALPRSP
jgi:aminoglycoside phosphotransferase family enzyme/predicted kinase